MDIEPMTTFMHVVHAYLVAPVLALQQGGRPVSGALCAPRLHSLQPRPAQCKLRRQPLGLLLVACNVHSHLYMGMVALSGAESLASICEVA